MKIKITLVVKPALIIILYIFSIPWVQGQHLTVEPYYEKNIFGNQYGGILSWEFKKSIQVGGFYQQRLQQANETPVNYKFFGMYFKVPIYRQERLALSASIRGGLANNRFVIIVPGIETTFKVFNMLSIASIISIRGGTPALGAKAILKLF